MLPLFHGAHVAKKLILKDLWYILYIDTKKAKQHRRVQDVAQGKFRFDSHSFRGDRVSVYSEYIV